MKNSPHLDAPVRTACEAALDYAIRALDRIVALSVEGHGWSNATLFGAAVEIARKEADVARVLVPTAGARP